MVSNRSRTPGPGWCLLLLGALACGGGASDLAAVSTVPPPAPTLAYSATGYRGFPVPIAVTGASSKLTYDWRIISPGTGAAFKGGGGSASGSSAALTATTTGTVTVTCVASRSNGVQSPAATATVTISPPSNSAGSFQAAGALSTPRQGLAAVVLGSDSILVTGGWAGAASGPALNTTEIYTVSTQASAQAHSMNTGRAGHAMVQVPGSNQVLVIGGAGGSAPPSLTSGETYDPGLAQFSPVPGGMASERFQPSATAIPGGVLVSGGVTGDGFPADTEDLLTLGPPPFFSAAGTEALGSGHSATLVNGKVLLVGRTRAGDPRALLYDPLTKGFSDPANQPSARSGHQAVLLTPQGAATAKVLILGGSNGGAPLATAEFYDPFTGRFTPVAATMASPRQDFAAVRLASGKVLILGGSADGSSAVDTAELFDPVAVTFTPIVGLGAPRRNPVALPLDGGKVLVLGGSSAGQGVASVELFTPAP